MKNAKDMVTESHHFPTVWAKHFGFGALSGVILGSAWHFISPANGFAIQKLMAATGERHFSGRLMRLFKATAPTHAAWGGAAMLGYHLVIEFLRHHEHTNLRPMFIDH